MPKIGGFKQDQATAKKSDAHIVEDGSNCFIGNENKCLLTETEAIYLQKETILSRTKHLMSSQEVLNPELLSNDKESISIFIQSLLAQNDEDRVIDSDFGNAIRLIVGHHIEAKNRNRDRKETHFSTIFSGIFTTLIENIKYQLNFIFNWIAKFNVSENGILTELVDETPDLSSDKICFDIDFGMSWLTDPIRDYFYTVRYFIFDQSISQDEDSLEQDKINYYDQSNRVFTTKSVTVKPELNMPYKPTFLSNLWSRIDMNQKKNDLLTPNEVGYKNNCKNVEDILWKKNNLLDTKTIIKNVIDCYQGQRTANEKPVNPKEQLKDIVSLYIKIGHLNEPAFAKIEEELLLMIVEYVK
jgi:hypothetical protein